MEKRLINFNVPLLDSLNQPVENSTIAEQLSLVLGNSISDKDWNFFAKCAIELGKDGELLLDKIEEKKLKEWVEGHTNLSSMFKYRVIEVMCS